jgi:hypothetical protein
MRLFSVAKIPMYCESISHRIEQRKSGAAKVVDLALKIEPFTPQLAAALDMDEYAWIKRELFRGADASVNVDLKSATFRTPTERQLLTCYATPDSPKASIAIDQVKVTKLRVRGQKDGSGWVLYVHVSFGPLGKTELEYVNAFYAEQRFVSWDQAEPSLEFESDGADDEMTDADEEAREPMFDTETDGKVIEESVEPARQIRRNKANGKDASA